MGVASKAEIALCARLTSAAVGYIVTSLAKQQLIHFGEKRYQGTRGQPATMIRVNGQGAYGIGVRLDRTCIETVLIDFDGNLISRISHDMLLPSPKQTLKIIQRDTAKTLALLKGKQKNRLAGIGLAIPYNLESWLRELNLPSNPFLSWKAFDFADALQQVVEIPVYCENDGTAAAIAELFYGVGRKMDNFLYLFNGPGLGGGLLLNGEIVCGASGNAADAGLMPIYRPQRWNPLQNRVAPSISCSIVPPSTPSYGTLQHAGITIESKVDLEAAIAEETTAVHEWLDDCVMALTLLIWAGRALLDVPVVVLSADVGSGLVGFLTERLEVALAASAPESRTPHHESRWDPLAATPVPWERPACPFFTVSLPVMKF